MKQLLILLTFFISVADVSSQEMDTAIYITDSQPTFPGGTDSLFKYVRRNLKFPHHDHVSPEKSVIEFSVTEDGSITEIKIIMGLSDEWNNSLIETFTKMPKWIPAMINGTPVKTKMVFPLIIDFR